MKDFSGPEGLDPPMRAPCSSREIDRLYGLQQFLQPDVVDPRPDWVRRAVTRALRSLSPEDREMAERLLNEQPESDQIWPPSWSERPHARLLDRVRRAINHGYSALALDAAKHRQSELLPTKPEHALRPASKDDGTVPDAAGWTVVDRSL